MRRLPLAVLVLLTVAGCGSIKESLVEAGIEARRADAGLTARRVTVDGRPVAYLEREGDGPPLVLIHGFGVSKDAWLGFVEALPEGPRVLVPDLAGHGGSVRDSSVSYDAPRLAAEVGAWLDAVAPGPIHAAGNSLGGEVAALLALDRPGVQTLALYDPAGVLAPERSASDSLLARGDTVLVPTTRAEFDRLLSLAFVGDPGYPGPARDVLAAGYARRAPYLRDLFEAISSRPDRLRQRLGEIEQPTLLVWGAEDRILDVSAAEVWAAGLLNGTVRILPNVGHAPMSERPEETAQTYIDFVRSHREDG